METLRTKVAPEQNPTSAPLATPKTDERLSEGTVTLTHTTGRYGRKNTYYLTNAVRKPALQFTFKALETALPKRTYSPEIWVPLAASLIAAIFIPAIFAPAGTISGLEKLMIQFLAIGIIGVGITFFYHITFSDQGKTIRRRLRAKRLRGILKKPHVILREENDDLRICRLGLLRYPTVDRDRTTLIPKETYEALENPPIP